MTVGGNGTLKGHVAYEQGRAACPAPTSPSRRRQLQRRPAALFGPRRRAGRGHGRRSARPTRSPPTSPSSRSRAVDTTAKQRSLFNGEDISIDVERSAAGASRNCRSRRCRDGSTINLPSVSVPDISAYQRYLPDEWNATLVGGSGSLDGLGVDVGGRSRLRPHAPLRQRRGQAHQEHLRIRPRPRHQGPGQPPTRQRRRVDVARHLRRTRRLARQRRGRRRLLALAHALRDLHGRAPPSCSPTTRTRRPAKSGFWSLFQKKELKSMLSDVDGHVDGRAEGLRPRLDDVPLQQAVLARDRRAAEVEADLTVETGRLDGGLDPQDGAARASPSASSTTSSRAPAASPSRSPRAASSPISASTPTSPAPRSGSRTRRRRWSQEVAITSMRSPRRVSPKEGGDAQDASR